MRPSWSLQLSSLAVPRERGRRGAGCGKAEPAGAQAAQHLYMDGDTEPQSPLLLRNAAPAPGVTGPFANKQRRSVGPVGTARSEGPHGRTVIATGAASDRCVAGARHGDHAAAAGPPSLPEAELASLTCDPDSAGSTPGATDLPPPRAACAPHKHAHSTTKGIN